MKKKECSTATRAGWYRRHNWKWLVVLVFFGFHFVIPLISQEQIKFEWLSSRDGLSQNAVFAIHQDERGFLWLGTEDGLNRYDGYEIKVYQHDPDDPNSLSHNRVSAIYEDHLGELWIGTNDGLDLFDRDTETFVHYKKDGSPTSLSDNKIRAIHEDRSGTLWIGTVEGGLNRLRERNREKMEFKHYKKIPGDPSSLSDNHIRIIYEDKAGVLWIGLERGGLHIFNREKETFSHYKHDPGNPYSLSNDNVKTIYEDSFGNLWVGTEKGLNRFDRQKEVFIHFDENKRRRLSHNYVRSIYEDETKTLWIGTYGGGLNRWDRASDIITHYQHDVGIPGSLSNDKVYSIYQDKGGVLWFGTEGGLNKYDRKKEKFGCWDKEKFLSVSRDETINSDSVWSFYKDKDGTVWFGTDDGLIQWERETGEMKLWKNETGNSNSISKGPVFAIHKDSSGTFFIGISRGGLDRFDPKKKIFSHYKHDPPDTNSLNQNSVYVIHEDRFGTLWLGTDGGLYQLDRKSSTFTSWTAESQGKPRLSHNIVTSICEDYSGNLWIGTRDGLNCFNRRTNNIEYYKKEAGNPRSLSDNHVNTIYIDTAGRLWVGTSMGLNEFKQKKGKDSFIRYTTKDGLPSDRINGILEDENGRLWISTNKGISRSDPKISVSDSEPEKKKFRNYDIHDGLQSNEFNGHSCYKASDGEMFFGGVYGFNYFYPRDIIDNPHRPSIVITDFEIFNESVNIDSGRKTPLKKSITETEEIVLSYDQSFFAFKFAALNFTTPGKNQYEYKMKGFDKDWIKKSADNRYASYTNLNHGTYTFKLKGSNNDGIWCEKEKEVSIKLTITPPFWKTLGFRIAAGVLIILSIFGFYQYRTRRLRQKLAEERRVQEILRKSRDLAEFRRGEVENLLTAISSLFIAVDSSGKIFQWNETAGKFFGINETNCIGQSFLEILKDYMSTDKMEIIMTKGLGEGEDKPLHNFEIPINLGGKGTRLLMSVINPILDLSGKKLGFLLLAEDITHRREEEQRRNLSQKLESLGQMAANIAHEIKTPLQYISHNGQFVCESFGDIIKFYQSVNEGLHEFELSDKKHVAEKIKQTIEDFDIEYMLQEIPKAADQIVDGVSSVSNVIKSMKEYAHPGRGVMEKANINRLLESTMVIVQNKIKKILDIEINLYEQLPKIPCYPGELNQVFMNLLINAADAVQEKGDQGKPGLIKITTAVQNSEVVVSIEDNGCGIPDHIKDNVFNPFFTTKDVGKGTGQGLSLAHNIIEKHKGKIYFQSRPGEGTCFYIHLPIQGDH